MSNSFPEILKRLITYLVIILSVSLAASFSYKLPVKETVLFILLASLVFYIPGALINRFCCSNAISSLGVIPNIAVSLGTGLCVATVYMHVHYEMNLPGWIGLALVTVCLLGRTVIEFTNSCAAFEFSKNTSFSRYSGPLAMLFTIATLVLMLGNSHYADVTLLDGAYRYWQHPYNETIYHEGLINALNTGYPPRSLYMSGGIDYSNYHLGMHLQVHLLEKLSGIDTTKLIYFYFSTLYFLLIGTLGYSIAKMLGAGNAVAMVTGLLLFGSDFSFVSGLISINDSEPYPWVGLYIPVVYSLFTYNGIIPGLIAFLCFVVYLIELFRFPKYRTLMALLCISYSAYLMKGSMGFHIVAVSVVICFLASFRLERRLWIVNSAGFLLMLGWLFYRQGLNDRFANKEPINIEPFNMFQSVLERIQLTDLALYFLIPAYVFYLILTFGLRYLGYRVVTDLNKSDFESNAGEVGWIVLFFTIFTLTGFFLSEMIVIGNPLLRDNSIWFATQSLFAAWFLVSIFLIRLQNTGSYKTKIAPFLILALAYPSTIQFLKLRTDNTSQATYFDLGETEQEIISALRLLKNDSIIIHPISSKMASLSANFAGKETVLTDYYSFNRDGEEVALRYVDVANYFSDTASIYLMQGIAEKYGLTHILCPVGECGHVADQPGMYEILSNDSYRLFSKEFK